MRKSWVQCFVLALLPAPFVCGQVASSVISYNPGTGAASGFNTPSSALGAPSTFTVDQFGGPVDPFDPPYLASQIVSIGAGGSLTLQLSAPVFNSPSHAFGMDFVIYGNSGFVEDFNTFQATGDLFGASAPGSTQVSVSADNVTFYKLQSSLAPTVDRYFPTDGSGLFGQPVNPALTGADFNGKNLDGIRSLYAGSGGGASYDLAWARDDSGNPVALDAINFVRIDVLSGAAEIDGVVGVPEPATIALLVLGGAAIVLRKQRA
jgi:hypothetical protein